MMMEGRVEIAPHRAHQLAELVLINGVGDDRQAEAGQDEADDAQV